MKRRTALAALAIPFVPSVITAQTNAPRKIGLCAALTGPFAVVSTEFVAAYQLAVQHVNEAGGLKGRQVQMLIEDSKANPTDGIAAMRKLVQVDRVEGMITFLTNVSSAQVPLADELKMPTIAGIETPGILDDSQYMFACGVLQQNADPLLVAYWKQHGVKKVYVIVSNNSAGLANGPRVQSQATLAGAQSQLALINLSDNDFRGQAARVKDYNPDAIYLQTSGSTAADPVLIRNIREIGVNAPFYFGSNFYSVHTWREAVTPYSEGQYFAGARIDPVAGRKFVHDYRAKMGFEPGYNQGELYDGGRLLLHAMESTNSTGATRDAMASLKGLPSVLGGTLSMGKDHYTNISNVALWQVRRGVEVKVLG